MCTEYTPHLHKKKKPYSHNTSGRPGVSLTTQY